MLIVKSDSSAVAQMNKSQPQILIEQFKNYDFIDILWQETRERIIRVQKILQTTMIVRKCLAS